MNPLYDDDLTQCPEGWDSWLEYWENEKANADDEKADREREEKYYSNDK